MDASNKYNLRITSVEKSSADVYTCIKGNEELFVITLKINGKYVTFPGCS